MKCDAIVGKNATMYLDIEMISFQRRRDYELSPSSLLGEDDDLDAVPIIFANI